MKKILLLMATTLVIMLACRLYGHNLIADPDTFYHLKMAQFIAHGQVIRQFPWNHFTIFVTSYMDHHFLFHILLIPFALAQPLYGLDAFLIVQALALVSLLGYLLHRYIHPNTIFLSIFPIIFSSPFLFVLNVGRVKILSVMVLLAGSFLIQRRRYAWLFLLAVAYTLAYNAFFLLLIVALVYDGLQLVLKKKWGWSSVVIILGIALGILVHPNFPQSLYFYVVHIKDIALMAVNIPRGREWLAYGLVDFLKQNAVMVFLFSIATVLYARKHHKILESIPELSIFITTLIFLAATFRSQVFVIYWVVFAVLFAAYELAPYFSMSRWDNIKNVFNEIFQFRLGVFIILFIALAAVYYNGTTVRSYLSQGTSFTAYRGVADWLYANSNPGDIVFNPQWDQFPQLFYWDDKNYYIVGLDPTFMYAYNQDLYWQWRGISDDDETKWGSAADLDQVIRQNFQARYVFVELSRNPALERFLSRPDSGPYFKKVYQDDKIKIYEAL